MWLIPMLWGGAFLTGATALREISADTVSFLRFAITIVVGVPIFHAAIRTTLRGLSADRSMRTARWSAVLVLAATGGVLYHVVFYAGLARTEAPIASVVIAMNPLFTAIGSAVVFRSNRPGVALFTGLVVAFIGVCALAADKAGGHESSSLVARIVEGWGTGEWLCLVAAFAWTVYALCLQRFRATLLAELPSAGLTMLVYLVTTLALAPVVVVRGGVAEIAAMSGTAWLCMLYIGILSTVVAYTLYNVVLDRIGAARTAQLTYAVPALTTGLALLLVPSFEPTWRTWLGLACVTLGLVIADGRVARRIGAAFR
jgi:drug/metabolite transporter (DMT)-like permease